jgi:nitroreductase
MDALEAIRTRRSYGRLTEPAPTDEHLRQILEAGAAAPDHGELRPFRFTILRGPGLDAFGEVLEEAYFRRCTDTGKAPVPAKAQKERTKLNRAPMVLVVSAVHQSTEKIPWTDQRDAAVAATQNVILAAHALGYGAMWRTGDPCSDEYVMKALGLDVEDSIVGFVYLGTPYEGKELPPKAVDLDGLVSEYLVPETQV